jgi:lipoyl-dependent peroxiredoxin
MRYGRSSWKGEWTMKVSSAEAVWEGGLRDGKGTMKVGSGLFEGPYTYSSRFASDAGTNPEELIGAAHAGCFSMALSGRLGTAGYPPKRIHTTAQVTVEVVEGHHQITHIALDTEAIVPGLDEAGFVAQAEAAKVGCPVSRALTGVPITLTARLAK